MNSRVLGFPVLCHKDEMFLMANHKIGGKPSLTLANRGRAQGLANDIYPLDTFIFGNLCLPLFPQFAEDLIQGEGGGTLPGLLLGLFLLVLRGA